MGSIDISGAFVLPFLHGNYEKQKQVCKSVSLSGLSEFNLQNTACDEFAFFNGGVLFNGGVVC